MYYGVGLEPVDLDIHYGGTWGKPKGSMYIHLKEFMANHSITQFRKLLKIIRESNTPDEEKKILEWCEQFIEQAEPFKKNAVMKKCEKQKLVMQLETEIDLLKYNRDRYKRNSPPYKELSEQLKIKRQNLSAEKAAYRQAVQDEKGVEADKKFIKKCLETLK